jgi:hypothetical protein
MSPGKSAEKYELYAVLSHVGNHSNSGHYKAYVRDQDHLWHEMNDEHVTSLPEAPLNKKEGYMLFYARRLDTQSPDVPYPFPPVYGLSKELKRVNHHLERPRSLNLTTTEVATPMEMQLAFSIAPRSMIRRVSQENKERQMKTAVPRTISDLKVATSARSHRQNPFTIRKSPVGKNDMKSPLRGLPAPPAISLIGERTCDDKAFLEHTQQHVQSNPQDVSNMPVDPVLQGNREAKRHVISGRSHSRATRLVVGPNGPWTKERLRSTLHNRRDPKIDYGKMK